MRYLAPIAIAIAASACSYGESSFSSDYVQKSCEFLFECTDSYDSVDDCVAQSGDAAGSEECSYNAEKAKACTSGFDDLACPEEGAAVEYPAECSQVYSC